MSKGFGGAGSDVIISTGKCIFENAINKFHDELNV